MINTNNKGQVLILAVLLFGAVATTIVLGSISPLIRQIQIIKDLEVSKKSYFTAEAGSEDVLYRLKSGLTVGGNEILSLNGNTVTVVTTDLLGGKEIVATGNAADRVRKIKTDVIFGVGASFYYGIQAGPGGFIMGNATVNGNVYSNGIITGENGAKITGTAVSVNVNGLIDNINIGQNGAGDAWAHTVKNSEIAGKLYCQVGKNNNQSCDRTRSDAEPIAFPITDAQINKWKTDAALGGTIGSYHPSTNSSLGPKEINGNMILDDSNLDFTINGVIYVTGNVDLSNNQGSIRCSATFDAASCILIADGSIHIKNNITFAGSGQTGSFLLLASTLDCDGSSDNSPISNKPCGHHNGAIDLHNNGIGSIIYAPHGKLHLHQGVNITGAAAYKIELENNTVVNYDQGLMNTIFSSGPSEGFEILNWKEIK